MATRLEKKNGGKVLEVTLTGKLAGEDQEQHNVQGIVFGQKSLALAGWFRVSFIAKR
jgi:hypothetical protein